MPIRIQRRRTKGWRTPLCTCGCGKRAIYVGRGTKWGSPFRLRTAYALARVPAVTYPDREWEYEGRISAAGMRHDYYHPDGRIIRCDIRNMTPAETVECYRSLILRSGWPIDWTTRTAPTIDELRAELAGHDLVCWCPADQACHADILIELALEGGAS